MNTTIVTGRIVDQYILLDVSYHGTILHKGLRFPTNFAAKQWLRENEPGALINTFNPELGDIDENLDLDFRTDVYVWLRDESSVELLTYHQMLEVCRQDACGKLTRPDLIEEWALGKMRKAEITPVVVLDTHPIAKPTRFFRKKMPC